DCVSNTKPLGLACLMYSLDYDERLVPTWNSSQPGVLRDDGSVYRPWTPWTNNVQPYVKNLDLLICPDNPWNSEIQNGGVNTTARKQIYSPYGMNFIYLSKFAGTDPGNTANYEWDAISQADFGKPASIILLMDGMGPDWADAAHATVYTQPIGPAIQPPDADNCGLAHFCCGWGNQSDYTAFYDFPGYGGASFRHRGSKFVLN